MSNILRVEKNADNPFVQMHKFPINDERLSYKAKGILCYLLSKPDDWQVYEVDLQNHADDGKTSVSNGIKELMEYGYIEREIRRNEKGHFKGYNYTVYEVPPENGFSDIGLSENGKPATTNNELTNNKETNIVNYVTFASHDYPSTIIYNQLYKKNFYKEHPRIDEDSIFYIRSELQEIYNMYGEYDFTQLVRYHFDNLPEGNDGKVQYFLHVKDRYLKEEEDLIFD